jgi:hypothetical protein
MLKDSMVTGLTKVWLAIKSFFVKVYKYLMLDLVSTLFLLSTLGIMIFALLTETDVSWFLWLVVLFIFRGIMWQGQYVDRIRDLEYLLSRKVK